VRVVVCTYKHGGHVVRERVGDDGEAGGDESRGAERFHDANHQTDHGERNAVRTAVHEPFTNTLVRVDKLTEEKPSLEVAPTAN